MATILRDADLLRLIGSVIVDADSGCVRPNSYYLRLGSGGEFINTGKEFEIGDRQKKGIRVQPGHSVGVTAFEALDFRRETVHKIFPGQDLHGFISPSTDLSREGVVAPTTQIDAGFHGTLNWTLTNSSSEERRFVFKERLFRLTIFLLGEGETPEKLYSGEYQDQLGYVRSKRQGAPVGMKDVEWEDGQIKGGPEDLLENLIKSGYPWHVLGQRLKVIDQQFRSVTEEYSAIHDAITRLNSDVTEVRNKQTEGPDTIRRVVRDEAEALQNRWLVGAASVLIGGLGLVVTATSNAMLLSVLKEHGALVGMGLMLLSGGALYLLSRSRQGRK